MIRTISVDQAPQGWDVLIGPRLLDCAGERLAPLTPSGRIAVVTDRDVADHHGERLAAALEAGGLAVDLAVAPPGVSPQSWTPDFEAGAGDLVALFGGGAVEALAPAIAPTLARGASLVRIPTTLRSQVACVIDHGGPPARMVLADLDVLATLAPPQVRAGWAEALKYALAADPRLASWIEASLGEILALKTPALGHLVGGCIQIGMEVIGTPARRDAVADLGRAFARVLRAEAGEAHLGAAEATALGCAIAYRISVALGLCPVDDAERATWNLAAVQLPVRLEEVEGGPFAADRLIAALRAPDGGLHLVLVRGIGKAFLAADVDPDILHDCLIAEGTLP